MALDSPASGRLEVVERKGIGHPDTLCDGLAESFSAALSRYYLDRFGVILHHNVDKALLVGGIAHAELGGGDVVEPIEIILAGRAVTKVGTDEVPVDRIAIEASRRYLRDVLPDLDSERHVRIQCRVRPGSVDLAELYGRRTGERVLSNDTSCGVGFAPLTALESLVLDVERDLVSAERGRDEPWIGKDVKVMAVRVDDGVELTLAVAMVAKHLGSIEQYMGAKQNIEERAKRHAERSFARANVRVNAADDPSRGSLYLTVTGTSAESGDDGQVGRGNRASGLITPYRPMTMEAVAGKNAVSHVGKLYNVTAGRMAAAIVQGVSHVSHASCVLVSRIGTPIDEPQLVDIRIRTTDPTALEIARAQVDAIARAQLAAVPGLWAEFLAGAVSVF